MLRDISLHIHDLARNSIEAGATEIQIAVRVASDGYLYVKIEDNGGGMAPDMVARVTDPYTTGRTTRTVGLGIPFFQMACNLAGGRMSVRTAMGEGNEICGSFQVKHIDRLPLGNLGETMQLLLMEKRACRYILTLSSSLGEAIVDSNQIQAVGQGRSLEEIRTFQWIKELVEAHTLQIFGGVLDEIIGRA